MATSSKMHLIDRNLHAVFVNLIHKSGLLDSFGEPWLKDIKLDGFLAKYASLFGRILQQDLR